MINCASQLVDVIDIDIVIKIIDCQYIISYGFIIPRMIDDVKL